MKKFFNMIELTLAIAVVGIGMVSIMSLFPVGVNASRDAVGDNYAADSVEQILVYIAAECQRDWTSYISTSGILGNITDNAPPIPDTATSTSAWPSPIVGTNLFTPVNALGANIYGIQQPAFGNPDFTAHIRIWKAQITNMTIAGNPVTIPYYQVAGSNIIGAARIYAEVSWPVEKPYSKRTKRVYALELFKQN